ncbi:MAG: DUF4230 domain-containing protein [Alkalinema sp. CAN_BIN05]|nr:DUF4230 domain-containing protein [Alkalinema sp. CAN_BIN05]
MRSSRPARTSYKTASISKPENRSIWGLLFKTLGLVTSLGTFISGLVILLTIGVSGDWLRKQITAWTTQPQPAPQIDVRSVVVKQVQDSSELTTAIFTMEAVVPTQQDATMGGMVIGSTKLLYIAHGQVRAGIDLSKIGLTDVQAVGDMLTVRLPMPKLLDSKIDVSRSSVYDYSRGALGLGPDVAPQLQTLAQQQALLKITDAACEKGILTQANDRAKLVIGQLLKVPAYKTITVQIQTPDVSTCKASAAILAQPTQIPTVTPAVTQTVPPIAPSTGSMLPNRP